MKFISGKQSILLMKNENVGSARATKAEDGNNLVLMDMKVIILEIYDVTSRNFFIVGY